MHRFFVPPNRIIGDTVTLRSPETNQLIQVLRSRAGDRIVVLDNSGWEYVVTLEDVNSKEIHGSVIEKRATKGEPKIKITLYQGIMKTSRFEFVLQKGTELGISTFVPVICSRSVPKIQEEALLSRRYPRWNRIITEAAEQSHRGKLPILERTVDFFSACDNIEGPTIIPWEQEDKTGLKSVLKRWKSEHPQIISIGVFIGPEGGFDKEEIRHAKANGIESVSLGERILRAETAGVVTAAAIFHDFGDLGG